MTNSISDANRIGYDRWARLYDGYVNSTVATDDLYFPPLWAHVTSAKVLEIGCGTGRHTVRLVQQGNDVTAIDLSAGMLKIAREKLSAYDRVRFIEADFMANNLDLIGFDVGLTALVLEHIADLDLFFKAIAMALRPGGTFYMSEIHPDRIAAGTQANFIDPENGQVVWLTSFAHAAAEIETSARGAGLRLQQQSDVIGGDDLVALNADWARHVGRAMIRMWTFEKPRL